MEKVKIPTKKALREYGIYLTKEADKFRLTAEDLGNLYDLIDMLDDETYDTIKLNKMEKWLHKFHRKIERIIIPESKVKNAN
jgi:hypothetical protein